MKVIRKNEYPSKQTVNLVFKERSINSPSRAIPAFALFLVFLTLFIRFGVQGQLQKMEAAESALRRAQSDLNGYMEYNSDYDEIKELLEQCVMTRADMSNIAIQGNVCRVSITDVPLNTISDIVATLEGNPQVQYISVVTAGTENGDDAQIGQNVTANVTITLTEEQD